MNRRNASHHVEPLPSDYDEKLASVDAMLWREAAGHDLPEGLAQRTYEASVKHLPAAASRPMRFPSTARQVRQWPTFSRLAMAASVLLAVMVGVLFLRSPGLSGYSEQADRLAYNGVVASEPHGGSIERASAPISADQEWVLLASVELGHFAEMRHLSLADLNEDMATLVRELEM